MSHRPSYVGEFVYGALDGTITTFAVVSAVAGAALSPIIVIILGVANLIADGFSMAAGSYSSIKAQQEYEMKRRLHTIDTDKTPLKAGAITFTSFVGIGSLPLLAYIFAPFHPFIDINAYHISLVLTGVALFTIGALKTKITNTTWWMAGLQTLLIGGIAASIAYGIGLLLKSVIG